jgi:lambda family phage portal protein
MAAAAFRTSILDADGSPWQPTHAQALRIMGDGYKGGSTARRAGTLWHPMGGSADRDFLPDQRSLRARSRDQYRNNPLAKGAIDTLTTWVVGDGLQCRPRLSRGVFADALGWSTEQVKRTQTLMKREWESFGENVECDLDRIGPDVYALQSLAFNSALQSGDILTMLPMVKRAGGAFETKIQLVEADRVSNPTIRLDTEELKGGVRLDPYGAPYSYFVQESHPGDLSRFAWREVRAFGPVSGRRNAWLTYDRVRPGQTRGVPYLASCLEQLKQVERYTDAELMAAIVGGSLTVLLKTQGAQGFAPPGVQMIASMGPTQTQQVVNSYALDYGAFVPLQPGEDVEIVDPKRPNTAFGDFIKSMVEQIGVGLGMPFELLIKHFTASYSASRAAINEFWKYVRFRRWQFAQMWLSPIYEAIITEAILTDRLRLPGFLEDVQLRHAYLSALWLGPVPGTLNPVQEVAAAERRIASGLSSIEREAAEMQGVDWEEVHEERVDEVEKRRAAGLEAPLSVPPVRRSPT